MMNLMKPLGHKSYGSIPHLPGSRVGPMDYHISAGQAKIATEKARDKHDVIIIQEKLDGSNVAVAKVNGEILAITRSGYLAASSKYLQHHLFDVWVNQNRKRFSDLLHEGERLCGEWLAQAHGTIYDLRHEPFVAFDLRIGPGRVTLEELINRTHNYNIILPHFIGYGPMAIEEVISKLSSNPHNTIDTIEGAIWRVERKGTVDFLTKFVRLDKQDGKYLPENNGTGCPIFNKWDGTPTNIIYANPLL